MGLRPFVVTLSARVDSWEGSYQLQAVRLVYATDFAGAALRAAAQVSAEHPDIPRNWWQMRVDPEPFANGTPI